MAGQAYDGQFDTVGSKESPSVHTVGAFILKVWCQLTLLTTGLCSEGNYPAVRSAAFDGLLLLRALQEKVVARYIFAVLRYDSCRIVQRRLAQSLVENLPVLAAMDDLAGQDAGYVEEDARALHKPAVQSVDSMLKALRNSVGRSIMLRDSMMAVITYELSFIA
jgi:hypothetical protein